MLVSVDSSFVRTLAEWALLVKLRDRYTCRNCGWENLIGSQCHAHHIKPVKLFPEETLNVSNGLTLCRYCHGVVERECWWKYKEGDYCEAVPQDPWMYVLANSISNKRTFNVKKHSTWWPGLAAREYCPSKKIVRGYLYLCTKPVWHTSNSWDLAHRYGDVLDL